jgi:hypothetical protein
MAAGERLARVNSAEYGECMKKKEVVIVGGDDWEGIYIDGKLVREGHSIDSDDVLEALGIDYVSRGVNQEWLEEMGSLPDNLSDVQFQVSKP